MKQLILIIFIAFIVSFCSHNKDPINIDPPCDCYLWVKSVHTTLGVPCDADTSDDYIIIRPQYVLSYNKKRNVANWVAWELNVGWFGVVHRYKGNFITDTSLPTGYYEVKHSDFTHSGYDRGHMVMSEERTKTEEDNISTFILTNVLPQTPDLNRGVWLNFENYCNKLCLDSNKELFIYAGGIFHSNTTIGNGVAVPDSCFKIVVILERGQGLKDVTVNTPVIAVIIPNISGVRSYTWDIYKTTEKRIEASTGYNFLSAIPFNIQNVIENYIY
ncbi:MAG: DNA/RNA non-specific endonuclease [FCB group bacterium]|jgi:endonuclease G